MALSERLESIYQAVIRRNPGETEFHQAVKEVLDSLGPVLVKYPEFAEAKIIERICEPERQTIFRVPWQDDRGEVQINRRRTRRARDAGARGPRVDTGGRRP